MKCKYLLFLSLIAFNLGCESPDFRYPDLDMEGKERFWIRNHQQQGKDSVWSTLSIYRSRDFGDTVVEPNRISILFNGEKKADTIFKNRVSFPSFMKTPLFYSDGLEVKINDNQINLPLPNVQNIGLKVDSSWILETVNDVQLVVSLDKPSVLLLDSFCVYGIGMNLLGIFPATGDVYDFKPEKLHILKEFVTRDSLVYYPFHKFGIPQSRKDWNAMSKTQKADAINEIAKLQLPLYHISTIRQFQRESSKIVKSANPFRIPENISPLDEDGIFYGQFTAMEVIKFK